MLIFGHMPVEHSTSICDVKSFCVIHVSLVTHRWNIMSEGYVCTHMSVSVCSVCEYCILGHMSSAYTLGYIYFFVVDLLNSYYFFF